MLTAIKRLFKKQTSWERLDDLMFEMASPNNLTEYVRIRVNEIRSM